ncbi:hypothetical protein MAF45_08860 [Mesosutterella sp. OilRF-GAM-744-9]|uniref:Uncharacterized protein n=1 Tax=Mesosutterella porci TaxID=2915351 RepID=A0ABS9MSE8_9BURK|nr:hypothetical protein [Mesosutterella sp. oilRF-744-WT-GAM-9]MCG5031551.1 hypothetical protein [Mesosutterella sp. oilRF-744-WT-GAM-9]
MKILKTLAPALLVFGLASAAWADSYTATLTRRSSNLYEEESSRFLVKTKYCFEYAYSEDSLIDTNRQSVYFKDSRETCDLEGIYRPVRLPAGRYRAEVNREDDGWYQTDAGFFLHSSLCLELALYEKAALRLSGRGTGRMKFENGETCPIDGIYQKTGY